MWSYKTDEKYALLVRKANSLAKDLGEDFLSDKILDWAYLTMSQTRDEIVAQALSLENPDSRGFLVSWIESGIFAGFLGGWKAALTHKNSTFFFIEKPEDEKEREEKLDEESKLFTKSYAFEPMAKQFAGELSANTFQILKEQDKLLIKGLSEKEVEVLKICYESSLFSGFMSGVESAYKNNPRLYYSSTIPNFPQEE